MSKKKGGPFKPNNDAKKLRFKNFVFDCDSTLTEIEGLDELAYAKGLNGQVSAVTKLAMEGIITFNEAFLQRINLLRPTKKELEELAKKYENRRLKGVRNLVNHLKQNGGIVYIVSGGIKNSLDLFGRNLGIRRENIFGTELAFMQNGEYLDVIENELFNLGKAGILKKISMTGPTVFIGDGFNDLEAANECDLFIGFGGVVERQIVKKYAKIYYKDRDLLGLMQYFVV